MTMKTIYFLWLMVFIPLLTSAQQATVKGLLSGPGNEPVIYANVALFNAADSSMIKVEPTNESGVFTFELIPYATYFIKASYVGYEDLYIENLVVSQLQVTIPKKVMQELSAALNEVVVAARRNIVEVKADRMVFNVQGTINSAGDNGLDLMRKAPGVLVDNNNNITVLGRSGVMIYVDGKRLPLSGDELVSYLQNLASEQIDRIDIISNPGSKYDAEGNAGIIDIRLKKDKNTGGNGSVSLTHSYGRKPRTNAGIYGNYRNKTFNAFGSIGYNDLNGFTDIDFNSYQNSFFIRERNNMNWKFRSGNYRAGVDFFLTQNSTLGVLATGNYGEGKRNDRNKMSISNLSSPEIVDSILVASNIGGRDFSQNTFNINYALNKNNSSLNIDVDYGMYLNSPYSLQPNDYYDAGEQIIFNSVVNSIETPSDIRIMSGKVDYERPWLGGQFGVGGKVSKVISDNTFRFFDVVDNIPVINNQRSNLFTYDESVYAAYVNYSAKLGEKWGLNTGLRLEQTDSRGDLTAFDPGLQEPPVRNSYLSAFPSLGLSYQITPVHSLNLNAGRRINRPDYNVLNPFKNQMSELSYERGNPFLRPEIVNNAEIGYTLGNRFNFKLSFSRTTDQITRLIGPDEVNPKASYITWDNLAYQDVWAFNAALPFDVNKWWNVFANLSANHLNNQADYGNGAVVDVQAFSYNFFVQNTFSLPGGYKAELGGWYSGPGVWGGVFEYDPSYSINVGVQRKFFNRLNIKLSFQDLTYQSYWSGTSRYNGMVSTGSGKWDSRRAAVSISYDFGNSQIKSRRRTTGMESEAGRIGGDSN